MTYKLGLMGTNITRSKMPKLQSYLASITNESLQYALFDGDVIDNFDPMNHIDSLIQADYHGINVTFPYKQRVYSAVSAPIIEGHDKIGSYNTLVFNNGKLHGANTDYSGFKQGYLYRRPNQTPGNVLLCGAGGVGRAIAFALGELGAETLYIADIDMQQATTLCSQLAQHGINAQAVAVSSVADIQQKVDGLVNCTALGMFNKPGSPFDFHQIKQQKWAFDAVYTPLKTDFIQRCEAVGMDCMTGFDLWIFQGIDAFKHFTGTTVHPSPDLINHALSWLD